MFSEGNWVIVDKEHLRKEFKECVWTRGYISHVCKDGRYWVILDSGQMVVCDESHLTLTERRKFVSDEFQHNEPEWNALDSCDDRELFGGE